MTFALVFVNRIPERVTDAERKVKEVKGVIESHVTGDAYGLVLKVKTRNEKELRQAIKNMTIASGIGSVLTSIVYNIPL